MHFSCLPTGSNKTRHALLALLFLVAAVYLIRSSIKLGISLQPKMVPLQDAKGTIFRVPEHWIGS
jgi:hypothetical protein